MIKVFLEGFALRLKGEVASAAIPSIKLLLVQLLKALDIIRINNDDSSDEGPAKDMLPVFLIAGLKSLQMRLKLNLGDAQEFLESLLQDNRIKFGDVVDLIDQVGVAMENSEFLNWYDNVPWIHEFINAFRELAFADVEIGLTHKSFSTSIRAETSGIRELFEAAMQGMETDTDN